MSVPRQRMRPILVDGQLRWVDMPSASSSNDCNTEKTAKTSSSSSSIAAAEKDVTSDPSSSKFSSSSSSTSSSSSLFQTRTSSTLPLLPSMIISFFTHRPWLIFGAVVYSIGLYMIPSFDTRVGYSGVFFCLFGIVYMCTWGLSKRQLQTGELSAYSIFNPRNKKITGTLTSDQLEAQIRGGPAPQENNHNNSRREEGADLRWRLAGQGHTIGAGGGGAGGVGGRGRGGNDDNKKKNNNNQSHFENEADDDADAQLLEEALRRSVVET